MKAAVLREINKPLEIEDIQHGDPAPREVLVRTVAAGVCHSDLHFQNGSYPYPLPAVLEGRLRERANGYFRESPKSVRIWIRTRVAFCLEGAGS